MSKSTQPTSASASHSTPSHPLHPSSLLSPAARAQAHAQLLDIQDSLQAMLADSAGTTFLAIFVLLSLLPMLTFLAVVLSAAGFLAGLATVLVLFSVGTVVCLSTLVLVPTLCFTFFVAASLTTALLGVYAAHRLLAHFRESDNAEGAVRAWLAEAKAWANPMTEETDGPSAVSDPASGETGTKSDVIHLPAAAAAPTPSAPAIGATATGEKPHPKLPPSSMSAPLVLVDALRSPSTATVSPNGTNGTLYAPVLVDRDGKGVRGAAYGADEKHDEAAWEVKLERGIEVDVKEWGSVPA